MYLARDNICANTDGIVIRERQAMSWVSEELKYVDLGDKRRNHRLVKIVEDLSSQPEQSVPQASRDGAAVQGVYKFWGNPHIKASAILAAHTDTAVERIKGHETILAIQDTTELDFSQKPVRHARSENPRRKGMGPLSNSKARGLKVHTVLAASAQGVPLGVLEQKVWAREVKQPGDKEQRRRTIAQKESQRWLDCLDVSQSLVSDETRVITVGDREADIYQLFAMPRRPKSEFLIRAAQNRNTKSNKFDACVMPLFEAIGQTAVLGEMNLELQRTPRRKARSASLNVRVSKLWLQAPAHLDSETVGAIEVNVILAIEEDPPSGEKAICWLLLTTLAVTSLEEAIQCLKWYSYRWLIERYLYCLKSGCKIEELQLESGERIKRALATYAIVAWRLLWLTYESRRNPERTVDGILEPYEWQALYCRIHKTNLPSNEVPSLGECVRWIAQLGGFLGRKGDGDPGVKTLWRGLKSLHNIGQMWQLMREER